MPIAKEGKTMRVSCGYRDRVGQVSRECGCAPRNYRTVSPQCEILPSAYRNGDHVAQSTWHVCLVMGTITPRDHFAFSGERRARICSTRCRDGVVEQLWHVGHVSQVITAPDGHFHPGRKPLLRPVHHLQIITGDYSIKINCSRS